MMGAEHPTVALASGFGGAAGQSRSPPSLGSLPTPGQRAAVRRVIGTAFTIRSVASRSVGHSSGLMAIFPNQSVWSCDTWEFPALSRFDFRRVPENVG